MLHCPQALKGRGPARLGLPRFLCHRLEVHLMKLGEERYSRRMEMSDRMRAHFEADPDDTTDDALKGREIIDEMRDLLKQSARKS